MKVDELQKGDWVYVPHNGNATHYGKITAILPSGAVEVDLNGNTVLCSSGSVESIPLTPEILEKNGFVRTSRVGAGNCYIWNEKSQDDKILRESVFVALYPEPIFDVRTLVQIEATPRNGSGVNKLYTYNTQCVHQLQHDLKIFEIKKEITL